MSTTIDKEKKYTLEQKRELFYAMEYLAKAGGATYASDVDREVFQAFRYLTEFVNGVKPCPQFTEDVSNVSRCVHTYLRKYCDDSITTLLYTLVARNQGMGVWHALCKAIHDNKDKKKQDIYTYIGAIESYYRDNDELPENGTMYFALRAWLEPQSGQDFLSMLKTFKEDKWL